ncbi:trypsin-like serine protease [Microtetraspora sp. AC03309]|uniref:S1 family peptidase n=1 Tax=Microtetraspora sp. AC03309 TaxID=2779376 RepID=UPI001E510BEA|nr:S1 family peptidase [Microtetraspora sp. AC03309]MCC5581663.1 trypsin-like serine protease [Microtetraspora sp. AC03309]
MRRTTVGLAAALALTVVSGMPAAALASAEPPPGPVLLSPQSPDVKTLPEPTAQALDRARKLAEQHPDDFSEPWVDPETGQVVLGTVTGTAGRLAADQGKDVLLRPATRSKAVLEKIKDGAIGEPAADIPNADAIRMTRLDAEHNRVIITVNRTTDALLQALTARYGADAFAVEVDPAFNPTKSSRSDDGPDNWGGAAEMTIRQAPDGNTINCSSGIPVWMPGDKSGMLTAGHCIPKGGYVFNGNDTSYMGWVSENNRENWYDGWGTTLISGQTVYRGDLSLIEIPNGFSGYYIYRGSVANPYTSIIGQLAPHRAGLGDEYCTSGYKTGEVCGWKVVNYGVNVTYASGEIVRNAVSGYKSSGKCVGHGDSGGPTYYVMSNGRVQVKGINSGGSNLDNSGDCREFFTDVWDALDAFPGIFPRVLP